MRVVEKVVQRTQEVISQSRKNWTIDRSTMSDYEERFDDTRYSTPVPELDDHRNQSASVAKPTRSRRGTVDTLYGANHQNMISDMQSVNDGLLHTNARDFEHAIEDGDSRGHSPIIAPAGRRPTVTSLDPRDMSPPNSVKAFAQARRRERSDVSSNSVNDFRNLRVRGGNCSLKRTSSGASGRSRRSRRSRRYTNDADAKSIASSILSEAEEDVCFPQQEQDDRRDKKKLYIDFEMLEDFVAEEEREHTPPKHQPQPKVFNDLRPQQSNPKIVDSCGKLVVVPSEQSSIQEKLQETALDEKFGHAHIQQSPFEQNNRFSFFSSAWEATTHANEFGDLIMPGESIQGLFEMPDTEEDGVWWLNMNSPTEEEIRTICKAFGVHPLTIEDIEKQETREKIELFPSYYFACFRSFQIVETEDEREYEPLNIYVIVFREGTLSFSFAPNPHAAHVRKRITALKEYIALSSDWICYALM